MSAAQSSNRHYFYFTKQKEDKMENTETHVLLAEARALLTDAERQVLIEKFLASCDELTRSCKRMQESIDKMNIIESEKSNG